MLDPDQTGSVRGGDEQKEAGKGILDYHKRLEINVALNLALTAMSGLKQFTATVNGSAVQRIYREAATSLYDAYTKDTQKKLTKETSDKCFMLMALISSDEYNPTQRFNIAAKFLADIAVAAEWHTLLLSKVQAALLVNKRFVGEKSVLLMPGAPNINDLAIDAAATTLMVGARAQGLYLSVDERTLLRQAST